MFVPNFEAITYVTSVLGPENRPGSLAYKAVSFKNGLGTAKHISHGYIPLDILSSQPTHFRPR